MDERVRGYIESMFDRGMKREFASAIGWIEQEMPISSLRDLILGYVLGTFRTLAIGAVTTLTQQEVSDEDSDAIRTILKRRLPEIVEKTEKELHR